MEGSSEYIYRELKRRIIDLEYKPGELINEKDLIEEFKVSRTPIREALLKLSEKSWVNFIPRVGIYVSQIDLKHIKNAYEVKKSLEALASELASVRATDDEIKEILSIVEEMESYDTKTEYSKIIQADQVFHKRIAEISKNELLTSLLEDVNSEIARFLLHIRYVIDDPQWFHHSLQGIAYAIRDRDPKKAKMEAQEHSDAFLIKLTNMFFR
ncbi:MAG: GntR family transcriptional regulator [Bacillota bacterium]|nr:GntR family transcriptional regulator [Bacillota bacterium]